MREYPGYKLVWHDEFEGDALDLSKWSYQVGRGNGPNEPGYGWGNGELQYYTDGGNLSVKNGLLTISARGEAAPDNGSPYTSSRIYTRGKFSFVYGRIEARMSLPTNVGMWPAFWLLPEDSPYGGWPYSGEIDIMERLMNQSEVNATGNSVFRSSAAVHVAGETGYDHYFSRNNQAKTSVRNFHLYTCLWDQEGITMMVDEVPFLEVSKDDWNQTSFYQGSDKPFDVPFYILLNLAVGGQAAKPLPSFSTDHFKIDYVRVYQAE